MNLAPHVMVEADYEAMSRRAAQVIVEEVRAKSNLLLCCATGSSPQRTYELLAEARRDEPRLFERLRVVKLDEWGGLASGDPATCESYLRRWVIEPLRIATDRYLTFRADTDDPTGECERIREMLLTHGPIDLCVLGLGINGHLGMNEPANDMTPVPHVATLTEQTQQHAMLRSIEKPVRFGITLGMSDILHSRKILLLISGPAKRDAYKELLRGGSTPRFPASFLWLHSGVTCICDRAAAGELDKP